MVRTFTKNEKSALKSILDAKGNYTLLLSTQTPKQIVVGKLGLGAFPAGIYAYTGSAFGKGSLSLGGRILRHARRDKAKRWHIDYLLSDDDFHLAAVVAGVVSRRMECELNKALKEAFRARIPFLGFGSSDCTERCGSHLLFLGHARNVVERTVELYEAEADGGVYLFRFA